MVAGRKQLAVPGLRLRVRWSDGHIDRDCNHDEDPHAVTDGDPNAHGWSIADADEHTHSDGDADEHTHSDGDADCDGHSDDDADTDNDADGCGDAHVQCGRADLLTVAGIELCVVDGDVQLDEWDRGEPVLAECGHAARW